jgi:putative peptidoglycan lipid II flippase
MENNQSTNRRIANAYFIMMAASMAGHLLSMAKEMIVANFFGITNAMDAFYTAQTVPILINNVLISPFNIIFIPIFIKYKLQNQEEANRITSVVTNYITIFLIIASAAVFLSSEYIIKYGFGGLEPSSASMAIVILRITSISIILTGLVNVTTGILNAYEHFLWPAVSQMFITISIIVFIIFFSARWGIYVFAWGLVAGTLVQLVFLAPVARKHGYRHYFDFDWRRPELREMLKLLLLFLVFAALSGVNLVVNRIMASWLPEGSISALAYADKLVQMPLIIFSGSMAVAIYPFFSRQAAENKIDEMKDTLSTSIRMSGFIFIPLAIFMMILAEPTIQLLFERGKFDHRATVMTSATFICYAFQLFSMFAAVIMMRLFFVFQDMKSIFKAIGISIPLNIALNFILMKTVNPPAAGIALSTSIGCLVTAVIYFYMLKKRLTTLHGIAIIKSLAKTAAVGLAAGAVVFAVFSWLNAAWQHTAVNQFFKLAIATLSGAAVFVTMAYWTKMEEAEKIFNLAKNKIQNIVKI